MDCTEKYMKVNRNFRFKEEASSNFKKSVFIYKSFSFPHSKLNLMSY